MTMTLTEKERALRDTVALPTAGDWSLLVEDEDRRQSLIAQLNEVLVQTLQEWHRPPSMTSCRTFGGIGDALDRRLNELHAANPDAGITDSETYITAARFFGINSHPSLYDFIRHRGVDVSDVLQRERPAQRPD